MTGEQIARERAVRKSELAEMIALVDGALRPRSDQSMLTDYPLVYQDENLQNIRVMEVDGRLVSVVPYFPRTVVVDGCRFTIGIISPTATDPDFRKRGYGLTCLKSCIRRMTESGIDLSVLWTLVTTFPFYESGQYQAVRGQEWLYQCSGEAAYKFTDHGEQVVEYDPAGRRYIDDIQAMHEREICGVQRGTAEYPVLFNLPKIKTFVALRSGVPAAYLMVGRGVNKPGLVEGGGFPESLETLVHHALRQLSGGECYPAYSYLTPSVLGNLLESRIPECRKPVSSGPLMIRMNHGQVFFRKISAWLEKRNEGKPREFSVGIEQPEEVISFRFSKEGLILGDERLPTHVQMSRRELTSVVFGPHPERPVEAPDFMAGLFPFYFPLWMLDHS